METKAFGIEYQSDTPEFTDELRERVRRRLEKLSKAARIRSASVAVHTITDARPQEYRVRIVLQTKSQTPTVIDKGSAVPLTLSRALDALERQVRSSREKKRAARRKTAEIVRA
jgi:ribosome-associated translation inhibitor RaiA